jgi:galactokinase
MNDQLIQNTIENYCQTFGVMPEKVVLAPGRINIIGEHIDYNDGFVLPAAIDKIICLAFGKNDSNHAQISAIDLNDTFQIDLNQPFVRNNVIWTNYLLGVLNQLKIKGFTVKGFNCVLSSNIPMGAGLSSSAALECGFLFGINQLFCFQIPPVEMAVMGQKAEHWAGMNCGIMDQFASVLGQENKAIKIDCKTLEYEYYDADFKEYALVLFDSNVKHSHLSSGYNTRRKECEEGLKILKNHFPEISSFRDCTENHILEVKSKMPENVFKRCHFVVKEINRVLLACDALENQDLQKVGQLMFEAHQGLSEEYEVSCAEIDFLVNAVKQTPAVIGARIMGGGFGGCTINLIEKAQAENVKSMLTAKYFDTFGIELKIYDVNIGKGVSLYTPQ